jgi:hypothetical protein
LLILLLFEEGQLAQVVGIAQRVAAGGVGTVASPAVMHADAAKVGQDANRVSRLGAASGMDGVVGEARGAGDVRPGEPSRPADAGLVAERNGQHWRLAQRRFECGVHRLQLACRLVHPADQRAARQPRLQLLHTHEQRSDPLTLALILGFQFGDTVLWRHAFMLYPQRKSV